MKRSEGEELVSAWEFMFAEDNAAEVGAAVKQFIATDTKGFPPSVGAIKAMMGAAALPAAKGNHAEMRERADRIRDQYHALGRPSPAEALAKGIPYSEWSITAKEAEARAIEQSY